MRHNLGEVTTLLYVMIVRNTVYLSQSLIPAYYIAYKLVHLI